MKKLFYNFKSIIYCICEAAIGVLLIINPLGFTSAIIRLLGVALSVMGVLSIIRYFKLSPEDGAMTQGLSKGLILTFAGVFCIFCPEWFSAVFPILAVVYGIVILVIGLIKIQWTVDILRNRRAFWFIPAIGALTSIVLALIILANPFATATVMWTFIGISLIFEAIIDAVSAFFENKKLPTDASEDSGYEVEIED